MTSSLGLRPVTGWSGNKDYFTFREYDRFDPEAVLDVLDGKVAGVMFRGMVPPEVAENISQRFWNSPDRKVRGVEAPGYYIGAYTWNKPTKQYLDEAEEANPILRDLLDVPNDPMKQFYAGLGASLARRGAVVRPAEHEGRSAAIALFRSWHGRGAFALEPHDDDSQCSDPQMADFERNKVFGNPIAALNICLENEGGGGRLVYWNIQPDLESKRRLGVEYTGSPYPAECLVDVESKWIDVHAGDVYVFNGAHVHAVEPNTTERQTRTTLAAMMAYADPQNVVTWS
ncbi:hypothetical protein ACGFIK_18855 [Micromonospora sp. NPDC048871]|uniref:2OG-Fe(II)-dependent halogenase WelO5 family protein n=1 Tax=unclassified Micromonospora TaxID=2617518 RepID=UPI002E12125C|nr:hypothetical protein OIE53_06645 [Micromonospora sp. NBC_01739]